MAKPNDWICLAEEDLKASKSLLKDMILGPSIYHTQQCAEKSLKGYLSFKQQGIKKTHDLVLLVKDCIKFDPDFDIIIHYAVELNPYVSKTRYPEDCLLIPDMHTVKNAINLAQKVLNFVKSKIKSNKSF